MNICCLLMIEETEGFLFRRAVKLILAELDSAGEDDDEGEGDFSFLPDEHWLST